LLPYTEDEVLQDLIDYTVPPLTFGASSGAANAMAAQTVVPMFLCPSDQGQVPGVDFGPNNYVGNTGTGTINYGNLQTGGDGVFFDGSKIAFRHITDGTAHTAAFSESLLGDNVPNTGTVPLNSQRYVIELAGGADTTEVACDAGVGTWSPIRGAKWINGHYGDTLYNHYYLPNAEEWDCGNQYHNKALTSARSMHTGGVQVAFCDGHLAYVSNEVDLDVWRAFATYSGDEVFSFSTE
jgi:prepilin-type processing-associated H-X9-DG protein